MTAVQKIQIFLSTARQRLNELLQVETRSAEEQTELETLTAEVTKREPELRAALAAEPDPAEVLVEGDAEVRELARLTERANVGAIFAAALEHRNTEGEAAELQKHHGIGSHQIPLSMLRIDRGGRGTRSGDSSSSNRRRLTIRSDYSGLRFRRRRVPFNRTPDRASW